MSCKNLFIDQFSANLDEENWYPPLNKVLQGLTAEQAAWHNESSNHSIIQLVQHLIYWNERYLLRFTEKPVPPAIESEVDPTFDVSTGDWDETKKKLFEVLNDLRISLNEANEDKLQSSPFEDSSDPWYSVFANINIHNAYHLGQIVCIRKLQGSWKNSPEK